jgi:hypothetical protein
MRGDQLARQWRILRTIESNKQGASVAELAEQEGCHPRTIWRDLSAIQNAHLPLLFQFNPTHDSHHQRNAQLATRDLQRETHSMTMEVGGLVEVMSWVMGVAEVVPEGAMSFRLEHFERFERLERAPRSNSYIALSLSCCFLG